MGIDGGIRGDGRGDRQIAAGWLLALIILATPTLVVVPPRIAEVPLLLAVAFAVALVVAAVAVFGLIATLRGGTAERAPMLAGIAIVACISLATAAGVLTA